MFLHVTTKIPKRNDENLFSEKGGMGFPTFMYLDDKGGVLAARAGGMDLDGMTGAFLKKATDRRAEYVAIEKNAASGDERAVVRLAVLRLQMRSLTLAEFRKSCSDLSKLDEGARKTVLGMIGTEAFNSAGAALRSAGRDKDKMKAAWLVAGEKILKSAKLGAEPGEEQSRVFFYFYLGRAGLLHERVDMLKMAVDGLKDQVDDNARIASQHKLWVAKLEELQTTPPKEDSED